VVSLTYNGARGSKLYSIDELNRQGYGVFYLGLPNVPGNEPRLNSQYSSINGRGNGGYSRYNGIVAAIESSSFRKLHLNGLQFNARYTLATAKDNLSTTFSESQEQFNLGLLDPFQPSLDYGYADFDVRHRFVTSFDYRIPYHGSHGLSKQLLGGWELSGIFQARSGLPFNLYDCTFQNTVCIRAELNGQIATTGPSNPADAGTPNAFNYLDYSHLTSGVFAAATGDYEIGPYPLDMAKRNSFRGPGFWNLDGGVHKSFKLSERYSLQFRGELYNVFNHANLYVNSATADISAGANFVQACRGCATQLNSNGVVVPTDRRNVQFAVKLIF